MYKLLKQRFIFVILIIEITSLTLHLSQLKQNADVPINICYCAHFYLTEIKAISLRIDI